MKRLNTIITFDCAYCGATNEIEFDPTAGKHVALTEDCYICCRPNHLRITVDEETLETTVDVEMDN